MKRFAPLVLLLLAGVVHSQSIKPYGAQVGGRLSPAGKPIQVDLPGSMHLQNKGGSDGAGLCVFTSIDHAARWQNILPLIGFRDYMTKFPGGGYPQKVDAFIKRRCAELKVPIPAYIQVEKTDLEILRKATATGRMVCITYCYSPTGRYRGHISHMVNLPHLDQEWAAILDNNYPGEDRYEWMTPAELTRVAACGGQIWAIIFLDHGPPPPLVAPASEPLPLPQRKDDGL